MTIRRSSSTTEELVRAGEQAALRRVATLVARGTPPEEIFAAVAAEVGRLLLGDNAILSRYDGNLATIVGVWSRPGSRLPAQVGDRFELGGNDLHTLTLRAGGPVRIDDYTRTAGAASEVAREAGVRAAVGVPITVEGRPWGLVMLASAQSQALAPETEARLADFTELVATALANAQARMELRRFADEQAALRRVATLVACAALPDRVFAAVAEEVGLLLSVDYTVLSRYDADGAATVVGGWAQADPGRPLAIGLHIKPDGRNIHALVLESGHSARIDDYAGATGDLADLARDWGYRSAAGVPIIVAGRIWGVMIAGSLVEPLAADTETRLAGFTELVATAISNAQAQAALTASRARLVTADDTARRRLERNLHDGAQQHLISLALQLREAQEWVAADDTKLLPRLDAVANGMAEVLEELREIARGIHQAGLAEGDLAGALKTLIQRCALPVRLEAEADIDVPEPIEVAAYYAVAEALANAGKYSEASGIEVSARVGVGELLVEISDDGRGGADPARGTGLIGLQDRIEALGGQFSLRSEHSKGTEITISLPLVAPATPGSAIEQPLI
ncbi:GAF domain-containing sensor histidine kinase [Jatrophihabitans sp. DSM 45814]